MAADVTSTGSGDIDVTIQIINWNLDEKLRSCLASILETVDQVSYEVYVIDNNSDEIDFREITREFGHHEQFTFIENDANEGGVAANELLGRVNGRYFLFLGPDTVLRPATIQELVAFLDRRDDAGAATAKLLNPDGSPQLYYYNLWTLPMVFYLRTISGRAIDRYFFSHSKRDYYTGQDAEIDEVIQLEQPAGVCFMVRYELLREDGYIIDPDFPFYFNDADLCKRISDKGYHIYLVPTADVVHDQGSSFNQTQSFWKYEQSTKGSIKYYQKHHPTSTPLLKALLIFDVTLRALALSTITVTGGDTAVIPGTVRQQLGLIRDVLTW